MMLSSMSLHSIHTFNNIFSNRFEYLRCSFVNAFRIISILANIDDTHGDHFLNMLNEKIKP